MDVVRLRAELGLAQGALDARGSYRALLLDQETVDLLRGLIERAGGTSVAWRGRGARFAPESVSAWVCDHCGRSVHADCTKPPIMFAVHRLYHEGDDARIGERLGVLAYGGHGDGEDAYDWARREVYGQPYAERFMGLDELWYELVPMDQAGERQGAPGSEIRV